MSNQKRILFFEWFREWTKSLERKKSKKKLNFSKIIFWSEILKFLNSEIIKMAENHNEEKMEIESLMKIVPEIEPKSKPPQNSQENF